MKPITEEIRSKVKQYIKNGIDISPLIQDICIRGEDFSYAKISNFTRHKDDMTNCNFSNATIGTENTVTSITDCIMQSCNFMKTKFLGKIHIRHCDVRNSTFKNAFVPDVEYQYSDFRGCQFCGAVLRIESRLGQGCKFDANILKELTKFWGVNVTVTEKEE